MGKSKTVRLVTLLVILAAVVAIPFIYLYSRQKPAAQTTQPVPVYAPEGELTPGFLGGLMVDAGAKILKSYTVDYGTGKQYTADMESGEALDKLVSDYRSYLFGAGWAIVNQTVSSSSFGVYATKGSSVASVSVFDEGNRRTVTASYAEKQ